MRAAWLLLLLVPTVLAQTAPTDPCTLQVMDRFDNPLAGAVDCRIGVFVLDLAAWLLVGALVMLVVAPLIKWIAVRTPTGIDKHIVGIVTKPGILLVFTYGLVDSLHVFALPAWASRALDQTWDVVLVVVLTYVIYRVWHEVLRGVGRQVSARTESQLDDKLFPLFDKLGGVIILLAGIWFVVASFGVNMTFFAAGGAIGGLVIAFAAQDTLGNLFAGVFILLDQPFREGDRIEVQELDTWGDVQEIGLRTTRIRTRDNRMVIVPNAVIGSNPVVNHSYPDATYRTETHVGIAYGSDVERARAAMIAAVEGVEGVDLRQPAEALFMEFGDSALIFRLRWWLPSYADARRMFDRVHTAVEKALREADVEIPFPQRVVHMVHNP